MAYCNKCGAYIPDGLTKCLACGFDPDAAAAAAQAAQQAEETTDAIDELFEEQRRKENEEWARAALERRHREFKDRQVDERTSRAYSGSSSTTRQPGTSSFSGSSSGRDYGSRIKAVAEDIGEIGRDIGEDLTGEKVRHTVLPYFSYLGAMCFIPLIFGSDDDFTLFHAKQGLTLFVVSAICMIIGIGLPIKLIMSIIGIINIINGKKEPLPLIGKIKWFN